MTSDLYCFQNAEEMNLRATRAASINHKLKWIHVGKEAAKKPEPECPDVSHSLPSTEKKKTNKKTTVVLTLTDKELGIWCCLRFLFMDSIFPGIQFGFAKKESAENNLNWVDPEIAEVLVLARHSAAIAKLTALVVQRKTR